MFPLGQTSFYDVDEYILFEDNFDIEKFTNDSCIVKGDTSFYYFDSKFADYISCLDNEDFMLSYVWENGENTIRPDSFYIVGETMHFVKFGYTYQVPLYSNVGDTIFIDNEEVYITCDSIYQDTYLSVTDSFRLYRLNIPVNGVIYKEDVLVLSKNYGIILFVQFN